MKSDRTPGGRGEAAAKQVVPEHPECVDNGKKFEDVGKVRLLGCRELATLVGYRVVETRRRRAG